MSWIVDTSVVVKWAVQEEGWEAAAAYIGGDLVAPDLLRAELANALVKKVIRKEIALEQALATQATAEAELTFIPVLALARRALEVGLELVHPVYDCFFLALAETQDAVVITADQRLARRCAGTKYSKFVQAL